MSNSTVSSSHSNPPEYRWTFGTPTTFLFILFAVVVFLLIVSGNTLVIFAFKHHRKLRRVRNYPLVGLAVTDLVTGFVALPLVIYANIVTSSATCNAPTRNLFYLPTIVLVGCSQCQLVLIAIDRCLSLTVPMKYRFMVTPRRMRLWIAMIWIVISLLCIIPFSIPAKSKNECRNNTQKFHPNHAAFFSLSLALAIPVFFFALMALYTYMLYIAFKHIQKHRKLTNRVGVKVAQARMRCLVTMVIVVGAFGFSLLPTTIVSLLENYATLEEDVFIPLEAVSDFLVFANSAMNPFIYAYFSPTFKEGMKMTLMKWTCKKKWLNHNIDVYYVNKVH